MAINWIDHIAPMFTQYDVIQMKFMLDLSSYSDVRANAQMILKSVSPSHPNKPPRMPLHEEPWTQDMLDIFRKWMDTGYMYSATSQDPPPQPGLDARLTIFIALSEFLTGFDDLSQNPLLAQAYLTRFRNETAEGATLDVLLKELEPYASNPQAFDQQVRSNPSVFIPPAPLATEPQLSELARRIIILWYTATIRDNKDVYVFGSPTDNQYVSALMWPAVQAQPMGYSTEEFGYWELPPSGTE